jgi:LysM repeat protein
MEIDPRSKSFIPKGMTCFLDRRILRICLVVLGLLPLALAGQTSPVQIANLKSDIDRLDQLVRALRLEVENLRRENRQLQEWVRGEISGASRDTITRGQLNTLLVEFEQRVQSSNKASREVLVNEVSREIEQLAEQTQKAISALARSVEGQPAVSQVIVFSDDYPQNGTTYTVKSGDSLTRIARDHGSRVEWIRNANRLSSDIIYPGQELFIPLKKD